MHGFWGFIRYCFGIIFYLLSAALAPVFTIGLLALIFVVFGIKDEKLAMNVGAMRVGLSAGVLAFICYWIGRFLTKDTLEEIWDRISCFSR